MPDSRPVDVSPPDRPPAAAVRSDAERLREHRAVERLCATLLPALINKLGSTGLAELEVREGEWKVRLRRPMEVVGGGRRATDRQFRLPAAGGSPHPAGHGPGSAGPVSRLSVGTGIPVAGREPRPASDPAAPVVTSPAVGIFRPRPGIEGTRVEAGDRLGAVDMLGIAQEVVAPIDGLVGELLAEAGDGVEYGQPLLEMEHAAPRAGRDGERGTAALVGDAGPSATAQATAPVAAGERP